MDVSKVTIEFYTSYVDRENKLSFIGNYIRDFLFRYFHSVEMSQDIRIILADNVSNVKKRITGNENENVDISTASVIYLDGQFVIVLPIGGFKLEIFPEDTKNYSKEFIEKVILETDHLIYHEMQHIKNRHDYPILAQILDNTLVISDDYAYFNFSACRFIDEYLATVNSQNLFKTKANDDILEEFENLHGKMNKKFLEKKLIQQDVYKIAYFYAHVFAINKIRIMENADELTPKIEEKLDGIEKKFFINIDSALRKYLDKGINPLMLEITRIMSDFYRLGSNSKHVS